MTINNGLPPARSELQRPAFLTKQSTPFQKVPSTPGTPATTPAPTLTNPGTPPNLGVAATTRTARPAFVAKKKDEGPSSSTFLFKLLDKAGADGASDLHVQPENGMWQLIQGKLKTIPGEQSIVGEEDIIKWLEHADGYANMHIDSPEKLLEGKGHTTVAFDTGTWRVRGSFRKSTIGVSCTFRMIPSKIPTLEQYDIPQIMQAIMRKSSGLVLIEGPTGSGKTTSIAALIDMINKTTDQHIYCVEDPIEFHHKPYGATVFTMREIGVHAEDYASAVENALRSKPNIIFVGEMLSNETKKAALHAATTGHLVVSTAHAGSVAEALDSFIGGFNPEEQAQVRNRLSQSLLAVMCQSLIPTINGSLTAAREIMVNNINFQEIISTGATAMLHAQMNSTPGCFTLEDNLVELVESGKITAEAAMEKAKRPDVLRVELERKRLIAV